MTIVAQLPDVDSGDMSHASTPSWTVNDLLLAYEQEYLPTKAPATCYQQSKLFGWLRREMGTMLLTDLTPAFLRQWRDTLSQKYAPGTVGRYMDSLSGPLTVAVRDYEWLSSNPLRKVRKPPATSARVRFLSEDERVRLLAACQVSRNPHLYAIVLLALSTGARKNELCQLRWRDLDVERGVMRIGLSKNKTKRGVPLLGPVVPLLRHRGMVQPPEAWVFARCDGLKPVQIDQAWQFACKRAGIKDLHFHDLRHTPASYLAMSGASLREIAEVLGHKSLQVTMKYTHLTVGHTEGVVQKMHDQFLT